MRGPRRTGWAIGWYGLGLLAALPGLTAEPDSPRLEPGAGQEIVLRDLPPILDDEEVRRQLTTGLTTTFAFRTEERRGLPPGGARVEVRYELWDEVFHVAAIGIDRRAMREVLSSMEDLAGWWKSLRLVVLDVAGFEQPQPVQIRLILDVVPFSRSEEADTQRWFAESVLRSSADAESGGRAPEDSQGSLEQVFSVLIATSIQREALVSYRWTIDLPESRSP